MKKKRRKVEEFWMEVDNMWMDLVFTFNLIETGKILLITHKL